MRKLFNYIRSKYGQGGLDIQRSWWSVSPRLFIFAIYLIVAITCWVRYQDAILYESKTVFSILLFLLSFMVAGFALRPCLSMLNTYHEITTRSIYTVEGIFSFKQRIIELHFEDISGVEIRKTIFDRLCGMGDIDIGTAMTGKAEATLQGIKNPDYYVAIIEKALDAYRKGHYRRISSN
jgi:uncharacterized membrane protein YdbT with pleckstrin-like domain